MTTALPVDAASFRPTEIGDLPVNWSISRLGDLFGVQQGKALSQAVRAGPTPRPFLRTANVLWGRFDLRTLDRMHFSNDEADRLSLRPGDLLVCEGGEIGRTALWREAQTGYSYQNHLHRLRARSDEVDPEFFMYWMQAAFLHLALYEGVGNKTTIPNLSASRLKQLPVPQPPFWEQRAIGAVLSKLQAAVELQDRTVATLKELKAATMAKLFREGLRDEPLKQTEIGEIPEGWEVVPIGTLFAIQQGKALSPKARRGLSPRPFLRTANVLWGRVDLGKVDSMDFGTGEADRLSLRPGDLLVCEGGDIGRTAMWKLTATNHSFQNHIHRLRRRSESYEPEFFMYWMEHAFLMRHLYSGIGNRTTIPNLSSSRLSDLTVPLPSEHEQRAIARVLDGVGLEIQQAEKRAADLRVLFETMLEALMTGRIRVRPTALKQASKTVSEAVLAEIVRRVVEAIAPAKIILFGSAARGEMGPDSDVDLLVVKSGVHRREAARTIRRRLIGVPIPIDVIVATPEDLSRFGDSIGMIYRPALREGRIVYAARE